MIPACPATLQSRSHWCELITPPQQLCSCVCLLQPGPSQLTCKTCAPHYLIASSTTSAAMRCTHTRRTVRQPHDCITWRAGVEPAADRGPDGDAVRGDSAVSGCGSAGRQRPVGHPAGIPAERDVHSEGLRAVLRAAAVRFNLCGPLRRVGTYTARIESSQGPSMLLLTIIECAHHLQS